ncbi:unnamed protein product [Rotaria sordida]|uniref:NAD(P)(+)--arginine ADP-ribosyltransferase n=1 Tax=Rotaria sordida TaxID=392033 RepID=A0A819N629_9BILA|nr:unnamed protein product [Rotaria sordida]CAF1331960.1 unnamed protein product [Rotaria sordida]CAF1489326.1 unnamed protein product [Rotaria sordida]CAF3875601.1 unnamed protein product [Rotaria sordida]CAF3993254.1 unnamed protein product [Rotaria sordida]
MAAKLVDESKHTRFSDCTSQPQELLAPIQGYETMPLVSLEEAVNPLIPLVPEVKRMAWTVKQSHFKGEHGLSDDETASILLYTMEWEPRERSFYIIFNNTLQTANRQLLRPWYLYLRLIMTSLAKLPPDFNRSVVYRGVKLDLSAQYPIGETVTWWRFSSCTTSIGVLSNEQFLGQSGTRTLFSIECQSAKSIKEFSYYPEEEEVLLPPARQFQVVGCLNQGIGFHIIQLKEIQPEFPLINPVQLTSDILPKTHPQVPPLEPTPPVKPEKDPNLPLPTPPALPKCENSWIKERINIWFSDPVIILLQITASL